MNYRIMNIKRAFFILFLCIVMSGCTIYRYKFYKPVNRDNYRVEHPSTFWIDTFENWDITIEFRHCLDYDNYFCIEVAASTRDRETHEYRETIYRANIQSVRILHGENLENEIDMGETKLTVYDNGKKVYFNNGRALYMPPSIKTVQVIIEMEFIDKENNITTKKYSVPMKLKEKIEPGLLTV